jgi:hypothetical protein
MRYPASEKLEIIRLVEHSHLPVRRTLGCTSSDILGQPIHFYTSNFAYCWLMLRRMVNMHQIAQKKETGPTFKPPLSLPYASPLNCPMGADFRQLELLANKQDVPRHHQS